MAAVSILVGGVPVDFWAVQLIVLGTPRPEGRPIDVVDPAGDPVEVRDPATQAPFVPVTLTGEAAGLSQVFLSPVPEGLASCDGGPLTKWSTAQFAEMLQVATTSAAAATEARDAVETVRDDFAAIREDEVGRVVFAGAVSSVTGEVFQITAVPEGDTTALPPRSFGFEYPL